MTEQEEIGERLNQFRHFLKLTQKTFAQRLGIQQGFLNTVLKGKKGIGHTILINIAKEYKNLNLRWLLTGEGEMFERATPYEPPSSEPKSGHLNQVGEGAELEYLKKDVELERIKRLLGELERRVLERLKADGRLTGDISGLSWYSWKDTGISLHTRKTSPVATKDQAGHADLSITSLYYHGEEINPEYRALDNDLY